VVIVAGNFDSVSQIIQVNRVCVCAVAGGTAWGAIGRPQTLTGWNAASRYISVVILDSFRIDTETLNFISVSRGSSCSSDATMTPVTSAMATVMVPSWCHIN
jgi:hypothetical protein